MDNLQVAGITILPFVKVGLLLGLLIYIVFAFVVVKQVKLMTDTLELGHEGIIKILSKALLLFAIAVFFFSLILL